MKRFSKMLAMVLMVVMMVTSMCTTAFALSTAGNEEWLTGNIVAANDQGVTAKESWIKNWVTTDSSQAGDPTPIATVNGTQIYVKSGKTVEDLDKQITKSINNAKTVDDVSNITDGLNISADTQGAAAMMEGFAPIISLILGIMVTLITVGMTIFSACDIMYIAFPVFRNKCEDAKTTGTGPMVQKQANGGTKLRFVTDDAQEAVTQGAVGSGKSPWAIYFGKRVMSYILLAIILFILLTGNISLITNIALKVVSGIMDVLAGLA